MALQDKTEAPTPRKRQDAREEGQVARSTDLNSALVLLAGLLLIKFQGPVLAARMQSILLESLAVFPVNSLTITEVSSRLARLLLSVGVEIAPIILGLATVAVMSNMLQVGLHISGKSMQFKGERLNPFTGITRMFSLSSLVELAKSIAKIGVVGFVIYAYLKPKCPELAGMVGMDYRYTCGAIGKLTYDVLLRAAAVLFAIAFLDYIYQRFQLEKNLKMTKEEVKEDTKRSEGDPLVKSKIRQKQQEISRRRMMGEVPKADVVITNPTHYAVALRYDTTVGEAPVVVAKGQRLIAQRIKEIAIENNVPIVENVQLARTLFAAVEIGSAIPVELYQAVAEILAYVYRLTKKAA